MEAMAGHEARFQHEGHRSDPALELPEGELLLLAAICHISRGDPEILVSALLRGAASSLAEGSAS